MNRFFSMIATMLATLSLSGSAALAQGAPPPRMRLTLPLCIEIALGQNPQLLATLEAEQAARWRYYQQKAVFVPTATVTGFRRRQTIPPALGNFQFGSADLIDQHAQIDGTIWTFGRYEAGLHARRQASKAAHADTDDARKNIVFQVSQAFYAVLLSRELVAVASSTLAQVQRQLDQATKAFEAGTSARFDVVRARTQLANARPPLIRAQSAERISRQSLISAMGLIEDIDFDLVGDFDTRPVPLTPARALPLAFAARPDLVAQQTRLKAAAEAIKEAQASDNPTVTFHVATDKSLGQRPPFDTFVEINDAQVSYNIPVFDGGLSHARTGEARAEHRRIAHVIQALKNSIRQELVEALAKLDEARAVIQSSSEAVREADEAVEIAEAGYEQGLRTNLEVLDAQLARDTARTSHAQARHDYSVARARLEQVIGHSIPASGLAGAGLVSMPAGPTK